MKKFNLRRFLTITVVSVIVLSGIWTLSGKYYTALMVHTLSPLLSDAITLGSDDETLLLTVRRDMIPIRIAAYVDGDQPTTIAEWDVDVSSSISRDYWFSRLPDSTAQAYTNRLDPRAIQSVLIPAISLLIALPVLSYRAHIVGLIAIVFTSFAGHLASLYLIIQRYVWLANHSLEPRHENDAVLVTGYYFGLLAPLTVLVDNIFNRWREEQLY